MLPRAGGERGALQPGSLALGGSTTILLYLRVDPQGEATERPSVLPLLQLPPEEVHVILSIAVALEPVHDQLRQQPCRKEERGVSASGACRPRELTQASGGVVT